MCLKWLKGLREGSKRSQWLDAWSTTELWILFSEENMQVLIKWKTLMSEEERDAEDVNIIKLWVNILMCKMCQNGTQMHTYERELFACSNLHRV